LPLYQLFDRGSKWLNTRMKELQFDKRKLHAIHIIKKWCDE